MQMESVDLTTAPFFFKPEQAFYIAGEINRSDTANQMGIELYPTPSRIPLSLLRPDAEVTTQRVLMWQEKSGADPVRVHLPWMYDWKEIIYGVIVGGRYHSLVGRAKEAIAFNALGPTRNQYGIKLAEELNVGVIAHPNVIAGLAYHDQLTDLMSRVPFVYSENVVEFPDIYQRDSKVLDYPPRTIEHDVVNYGLQGFVLGIDHLLGLDEASNLQIMRKDTEKIAKIIQDPLVLAYTKVIHASFPGHGAIEVGDEAIQLILVNLAQAKFKYPIRVALDFEPEALTAKSVEQQVGYVKSLRDWIIDTVIRYG